MGCLSARLYFDPRCGTFSFGRCFPDSIKEFYSWTRLSTVAAVRGTEPIGDACFVRWTYCLSLSLAEPADTQNSALPLLDQ